MDLNPSKGREQAGLRPAVIVSVDPFNHGAAELVVILPITSKAKGVPLHVPVKPPEAGLRQQSYIKCEDIRSISRQRLARRLGSVSPSALVAIEDRLRLLLGL